MNNETTVANKSYKLIKAKTVKEINSETFQYEHLKTGARLFYIKNDDNNKVFSISFKTPPEDNTGCPHILEHCVLNGSRNFPAKNTFTELMKGSMKTFLNAYTSSDKTTYPIASTNDKDFFNLMHVYLDAVFYPKIYGSPDALKQEGWHYELFKPEDSIVYRGVVYNEMKGAFSSPEMIIWRKNQQVQFPDTPYGYESGGDPEFIPELDWEKFKAFHTKNYHPSNCWIYLYGNLDLDKALTFIDEQYLSNFEKTAPGTDIKLQKPFAAMQKIEESYSIGETDNPEGKNFLSLNFTCSNILNVKDISNLSALLNILMDSAASPLKLALQNSGLCDDNYAGFDESCLQPTLSIICSQVKTENIEPLTELIFSELKRISTEGIDKKLIEAVINSREFALREAEKGTFFRGLTYGSTVMKSWLHGGEPLSYLEFEPILAEQRKGLTQPLYETMITEYLLENPHSSRIVLKPVMGLVKTKAEKEAKELESYKSRLDENQINDLINDNLRLQEWQSTPDTPEDIAKIPFISLSDIKKETEKLPLEVEKSDNVTLLKHPIFTNGIVYLSSYFDIDHLAAEDLPWMTVLTSLLGNLDTENHTFGELANEIDIHTGGISINLSFYMSIDKPGEVKPKLVMRSKCVLAKTEKMLDLVVEELMKTRYADSGRIHLLIKEIKSRIQMMITMSSHQVAINRMLAQSSQMHKWNDQTSGVDFYRFIDELDKKMETNPECIIERLRSLAAGLFRKDNLICSITSPQEDIADVWQKMNVLLDNTEAAILVPKPKLFIAENRKEGIFAPVNVQYCAQGGNFRQAGYRYTGKMMVLTNILRNDFLMQELRVKGGAYGIMVLFSIHGNAYFCSYRDPNLSETFEVYKKIGSYLKNFSCSDRDFEKYIIGTMAELDMPYTPYQKGINSDSNYISGFGEELRQQTRDEVLSTTIEDIRAFSQMIDALLEQNQIAVFGVEAKLKENSGLFDVITPAVHA